VAFLDWSSSLSVGIADIDAEHHELIVMLNDLHSAMASGHGRQALSDVLGRLVKYTQSHFAHEEELMRKHAYGESWKHTHEHRELTKQVLAVQAKFEQGQTIGLSIEVMDFLRNWLTNHIQTIDAKLGAFLKTKGVT
jgi:hemerythrin